MSAAYRSKMFPERIDPNKQYVWTREKQANGTVVRAGETIDLTLYTRNKLEVFLDNRWIEPADQYHGTTNYAVKHSASKEALEAEARAAQEAEAIEAQRQQDEDKAEAEREEASNAAAKEAAAQTHKPYIKKFGRNRFVVMLGEEKMTGEMSEADATKELEKLV